jgi:hypothetical protein
MTRWVPVDGLGRVVIVVAVEHIALTHVQERPIASPLTEQRRILLEGPYTTKQPTRDQSET